MLIRSVTLLTVLAMVIAACGGGAEDTTTSSSVEATTTTAAVEAVQLSYSFEPGTSYEYQVDLNQTIDMTSTGETAALGGEDDIPGQMSLTVTGTTVFTYSIADGPEPGTYEISITGDFSGLDFAGTVDGEPVDSSDVPEMAEIEPVDATVVVDEQGNVIPEDSSGLGEDFLGGFGGLDTLDQLFAGGNAGQFIGPPFPGEEVTVGETWSDTVEVPTMAGQDPITTNIESEVTGTDTLAGHEVFVIDTTSTTSAFEFDLAELLIGFMSAFVPEDATEDELTELDEVLDQLRFGFAIDDSVSHMTTWFDHEAGVARQSEMTGDTHMTMDVNFPDEATGEMVEFALDMTIGQDTTYRLVDAEGS